MLQALRSVYSPIILPYHFYSPQLPTKSEKRKSKGSKREGNRNTQSGRRVYWVLCVYMQAGANARREVRGDLEDGLFVARAFVPQA